MPYPSIVGSATSGRDSDAIDDSVTLPASIASGDLILVFHFAGGDDTRTFPSPWVEIKDETSNIPNTFGATIGSGKIQRHRDPHFRRVMARDDAA
jgi:hypothetical protein